MNRIFQIYKRLLEIHIRTKTTGCNWFHSDTETAYSNAFDCFHNIKELYQDTEEETPLTVEEVAKETYDLQEELKEIIGSMVVENDNIAIDNELRGLYQSCTSICWTLRKHLKEVEEEEMDEEETQVKKWLLWR